MRRQKLRVLNAVLSAAIVLTTVFVPSSAGAVQPEQGQYIVGDGSGGGGGGAGGANLAGGAGGNGGGGNDTITGTSGNDVIFGDGSGGGAGCRSVGSSLNPRGGTGGGGDDIIFGGAGDDIIFGDGFNGQDYLGWYPGNGGLGGGGNDVINGGAGYNNLFGMGGSNTFIVDSADNAVRTVIWDLKFGDKLLLEHDGVLVSEITTGSILDNAIYGDFDGDELDDDTRITFNGRPVDIIDVILSNRNNVGTGGEISPANSAPTVNLNDGIIACNFTSAHEPGFGYGFVNDRDGDKDWNGGTLEVQITSNANVNDRIGVYEETLLTPVLNISGTDVSSNGVTFGTIPPVISTGANTHLKYFVTGSSKFTVEFNNNATNELVRRFVNMLIFNTSASGDGNRIVTVKLTDKNGNSSIDTVVIGNTAAQASPVLTGAYTDTSGR